MTNFFTDGDVFEPVAGPINEAVSQITHSRTKKVVATAEDRVVIFDEPMENLQTLVGEIEVKQSLIRRPDGRVILSPTTVVPIKVVKHEVPEMVQRIG